VSGWQQGNTPVDGIARADSSAPVPPAAPEKPIEGDWLGGSITVFPDLKHPDPQVKDSLIMACPRLLGENARKLQVSDALRIEPSDDTYRRLLKARLIQGAREFYRMSVRIEIGSYQSQEIYGHYMVLDDLLAVTAELWSNDRNELIPRLKEFVILAKYYVRLTEARVRAGADPPQNINEAQRHRLQVEAALWKVLHLKPAGK
jgi:hypothetical protein